MLAGGDMDSEAILYIIKVLNNNEYRISCQERHFQPHISMSMSSKRASMELKPRGFSWPMVF